MRRWTPLTTLMRHGHGMCRQTSWTCPMPLRGIAATGGTTTAANSRRAVRMAGVRLTLARIRFSATSATLSSLTCMQQVVIPVQTMNKLFGKLAVEQNQAKAMDETQTVSQKDRCMACHGVVNEFEKMMIERKSATTGGLGRHEVACCAQSYDSEPVAAHLQTPSMHSPALLQAPKQPGGAPSAASEMEARGASPVVRNAASSASALTPMGWANCGGASGKSACIELLATLQVAPAFPGTL